MRRPHTIGMVALIALALLLTMGCAGKKQPKMLADTTVQGLPPVPPEDLSRRVTCVTEEFPVSCLQATTGSEHCKYMIRRNAERQILERLETLTTVTEEYSRESEALESALAGLDSYAQATAFQVQFSYHESNLFRQASPDTEVFLMRVCVVNDEAVNHLLRSMKEKAEAEKRREIADYADLLLEEWYDGKAPPRKRVEETTGALYAHFTDLYNTAERRMSEK